MSGENATLPRLGLAAFRLLLLASVYQCMVYLITFSVFVTRCDAECRATLDGGRLQSITECFPVFYCLMRSVVAIVLAVCCIILLLNEAEIIYDMKTEVMYCFSTSCGVLAVALVQKLTLCMHFSR